MPGTRTKNKAGGLGKSIAKARNRKKDKVFSDRHQEPVADAILGKETATMGSDELPIEEEILREDNIMHNMINKGRGKLESLIGTTDLQDLMLNAKMSLKKYEKDSATVLIHTNEDGSRREFHVVDRNEEDHDDEGMYCCLNNFSIDIVMMILLCD